MTIRPEFSRPGDGLSLPSRVQPWPPEGCSSAPAETVVDLVKDRDPGSSEQLLRSGERSPGPKGSSLTYPDHKQPQVIGVGEALFPRPSDPLAKGGDDKRQSLLVFGQTRDPAASGDSIIEGALLVGVIILCPILMFFVATFQWPTH